MISVVFPCTDSLPCGGSNFSNDERVLPFKALSFDALEDTAEWGAW